MTEVVTEAPQEQANPFLEFLERYDTDPVLFVREVFGVEPDEWQIELLTQVALRTRRIAVRSGHGVGKSTVLAWAIIWHILTKYPQKTVATAPTSTQLFDALAAETKSWIQLLPPLLREKLNVTTDRITLVASPDASFVSFATSRAETPEALAGKHSENILLIGDEGSGIPEEVYEAAAGSMSGHNAVTVLAGNPVRGSGYFYNCFHDAADLWYRIHVDARQCKRVAKDFVDQIARTYGELSNQFRVRVMGEFPLADEDTIIPRDLMESALERDVEAKNVVPIWGLDVARSLTGDASSLAKRKGNVLLEKTKKYMTDDLMKLVGWVKHEWDNTPTIKRPSHITIDSIGLGAGVADRLRELGLPAVAINVSETPPLNDVPGGPRYANLKAELWYKVLDWFLGRDVNLAADHEMGNQLVVVKKDYTSTGKNAVEGKKELKKRLKGKSPDRAEAFVLTFAVDAVSATLGSKANNDWKKPLPKRNIGIV